MKKLIFILIIFQSFLFDKDYNNAIGLYGGLGGGINFKTFISNSNSLEFFLTGGENYYRVTGLYEWNKALQWNRTNLFYGLGAHIAAHDDGYKHTEKSLDLGVDGIVGIEYTFRELPMNVGFALNPFINILDPGFYLGGGF